MIESAIVAGAGLGGLTAAVALARKGIHVDVYEQAGQPGEVGAGIQLSPNAMKILMQLGLGEKVAEAGSEPHSALIRHYRTGRTYLDLPLKAACRRHYGAPWFTIHRADLHAILVEAARGQGVRVHFGHMATGYAQDHSGIRLIFASEKSAKADILIASDGIESTIRGQMLRTEAPDFTGHVVWRGVIAADRLAPGSIDPAVTVWVGPRRHMVAYPLRGGKLVNVVAVEERRSWRDESRVQKGNVGELRAAFGHWHSTVRALAEAIDETTLWPLFDRRALPRWSDGRAVLIGDACHPMVPFMAQGAAMAIEDAEALIRAVAAHRSVEMAFQAYETRRKPRATMLQTLSRANAGVFHFTGGVSDIAICAALRLASFLPHGRVFKPMDMVYGYDPAGI
ncbi:MAG: FAD-dependent monooxygenase [Hyphomicrobiales bacterium]